MSLPDLKPEPAPSRALRRLSRASLLFVAGCTVQPLYGTGGLFAGIGHAGAGVAALADVEVAPVDTREVAQQVRNHLIFLFTGGQRDRPAALQARLDGVRRALLRGHHTGVLDDEPTSQTVTVTATYTLSTDDRPADRRRRAAPWPPTISRARNSPAARPARRGRPRRARSGRRWSAWRVARELLRRRRLLSPVLTGSADLLAGLGPVGQEGLQPLVGQRMLDQRLQRRRRRGGDVGADQRRFASHVDGADRGGQDLVSKS
jgi:LPS-assembly lipoprotein